MDNYRALEQQSQQSKQNLENNRIDEMWQDKKWIWQSLNYPHFIYNEKTLEPFLNELSFNEKNSIL